jgi:hypothetical protein
MGQATSEIVASRAQALHSNAATLPTPSGVPTETISSWRNGALAVRSLLLKIWRHAAGSATLTGPVYAVGYHDRDARWYRFAVLNGGADIVVSDVVGWIWKLTDVPAWASALAVEAAGGVSANVDVSAEPIETDGVP